MRLPCLQGSDFLQVQQTGTGKRGRGVDNAVGMYQLTIEKRGVHRFHLRNLFRQYNKKVNIMLVFCKISPIEARKMSIE